MKDQFRTLFTPAEIEAFNHVFVDGVDVDGLKNYGNVEITETEKDDVVTRIITFTSFDGETNFTKQQSYYKYNASKRRVNELRSAMNLAAQEDTVEGYKRAAKIKNTLDTLLLTV